jgi:TonB family protein
MTDVAWLGEIAWKGTVLLVASSGAAALLWRASAAARHFLWTVALGASLLLPVAIYMVPQWKVQPAVPIAVAGDAPTVPASSTGLTVRPSAMKPFPSPWLLLWALGCVIAAGRFAVGAARTHCILRRAKPADYALPQAEELRAAFRIRRCVSVIEAADAPVPMTCGLLRPIVVLPPGAEEWPEARLLTVLRHELAHVRRFDLAAQALGQAACCLYWFHPLAWFAARRLRHERERACDDMVLAAGTAAHEYAAALLDLARGLAARRRALATAPAMAAASDLESRIRTLFDHSRNRRPLGARTAAAISTAALAFLLPMASLTVHAQAARGSLSGVVQDPSRARILNCQVVAKNQDGTNQEATRTNAVGEYRFGAIPEGKYTVEFAAPGFALTRKNTAVTSGQAARLDATLEVGGVLEHITIRGRKPPTVLPAAPAGAPQRIRVGGNVQPMRLVAQTEPEYPADLQQLGIEGTVVIRAVISVDGNVLSPKVVNTDIDPRLANLAIDAVKQWRYQPTLLNGQPIETATTLTIDFTLQPGGVKSAR